MNFLNKLERKFGRYAVKRLTLYIIATYIAGYILLLMSMGSSYSNLFSYLVLSPRRILRGEIWRLVSWLLIPPSSLNFWTILMLFFYYSVGTLLEKTWGDFLYNVYIFFGLIMTVIGAFILYLVTGIDPTMVGITYSTYYVSLSIFFGFAMSYPDMQVYLFALIPIRVKYLAYFDLAYLVYRIIRMFRYGFVYGLPTLVMVITSLASTIIFFFLLKGYKHGTFADRRRRKNFQKQMNMGRRGFKGYTYGNGQTGPGQNQDHHVYGQNGEDPGTGGYDRNRQAGSIPGGFGYRLPDGRIAKHRCAVCGRTELDDPNLEFRFCSKCNGNYEYCQDHLFTHEHVK